MTFKYLMVKFQLYLRKLIIQVSKMSVQKKQAFQNARGSNQRAWISARLFRLKKVV